MEGAAAGAPASSVLVDWYEAEGSLGAKSRFTVGRVLRRAGRSWPRWVVLALVLAYLFAYRRSHKEILYESTVVLRVAEGAVAGPNGLISLGDLRDQLDELAFSRERLGAIMKKHRVRYGKEGEIDSPEAVATFRSKMTVTLAENDFIEDDQASRERRSARVSLTFQDGTNDKAYKIVHDLAALVVASGSERQKKVLEVEAFATREVALHASADLVKVQRESGGDWGRVKPAAERLAEAQKAAAAAALALRAMAGKQAISFEIVDPGRVPVEVKSSDLFAPAFILALIAGLVGGSLLAGVFDPRVLGPLDLEELGVTLLGRVPGLPLVSRAERGLPSARGSQESGPPPPRV